MQSDRYNELKAIYKLAAELDQLIQFSGALDPKEKAQAGRCSRSILKTVFAVNKRLDNNIKRL